MSLRPRNFDINSYKINRNNLLMDERRQRMYKYSENITQKNLGLNRTNTNTGNNIRQSNNYFNYYSSNNKTNDHIDIPKYNHNYFERMNNRKADYISNRITSNNTNPINHNLPKKETTISKTNNLFRRNNIGTYNYNKFIEDKFNLNAKTEKLRNENYEKDLFNLNNKLGIKNNYITNYIPDFYKIESNDYIRDRNVKNKLREIDEINKEINKIKGNNKGKDLEDINRKNEILYKYNNNDDDKTKKNDLFDYEKKLKNIKNEISKETNFIDDKLKNNEKKDMDIEIAKKEDYLEMKDETESISHQKANRGRARSVAPNKIIVTSEISKITNSLIGFNNLGSTCYMNSALQNIIHCSIFINKIIDLKKSTLLTSKNDNITNSFLDLCSSIIENKNRETNKYLSYIYSSNSISPSNFKTNFCLKHREYIRGQHDSIEFLRTLLDDMSKEINMNQNISAYKELTTKGKSKEEQSKEYHNFFLSRENSIIVDIFYNQMINIFTCACGFESYSFQKLLDIPLLLPNKSLKIDLSSLIQDYFKEEELDWSTKCEKCEKENLKHLKILKFSILNEIVIFSLQRFDPFLSKKNNIQVTIKEFIDLKDYCDNDLYKENTKYRLCGTINHIGNINYGHYYTYIRIGDIWYQFNDSIVKKVTTMDYESSSVCVLFYEKI